MEKIYIIEGPDGTGKTTLANEIAEQTKASIVHCSYDKDWNIKEHHQDMFKAAQLIAQWMPVVLDRWAYSELVYGTVFRNKPSYDVKDFLFENEYDLLNAIWIYCRSDKAAENHKKHMEFREEMYDDMSEIAKTFDEFVEADKDIGWIEYDYTKVNMKEFVKEIIQ